MSRIIITAVGYLAVVVVANAVVFVVVAAAHAATCFVVNIVDSF